jgi:integrase
VSLLILTGARRSEIGQARWDWLESTGTKLTVPSAHMKAKQTHVIHLNIQAREVMQSIVRIDGQPCLFPAQNMSGKAMSGYSKFKNRLDERAATKLKSKTGRDFPEWRLHDLRRTCATAMQRLGVKLEVIERVLAHISGGTQSGIIRVYQRHDYQLEQIEALRLWGDFVEQLGVAFASK